MSLSMHIMNALIAKVRLQIRTWAFATRPNIKKDVEHVPFENGKHQKLLCTLVQVWVETTRVVQSVQSGGLQLAGSMDMDCKLHR